MPREDRAVQEELGQPQPAYNPAQQQAIETQAQVTAVIAGPGTGKTRTLVARIAYLIETCGVRPEEITAVTFTNQAAAEMRQRLEARLGGKRAVSRMTIGTFHAICRKLLAPVRLLGPGEAITLAAGVLREQGSKQSPKKFLQAVSRVKNGAEFETAGVDAASYEAYCSKLHECGALDFDDLLIEALQRTPQGTKILSMCWWMSSRISMTPNLRWCVHGAKAEKACLSSAIPISRSMGSAGRAGAVLNAYSSSSPRCRPSAWLKITVLHQKSCGRPVL